MTEISTNNQDQYKPLSILDTIKGSQTQTGISNFEPGKLVSRFLGILKERDQKIVIHRFGLENNPIETLESIGKKYTLTRERVRQIEKDSLNLLRLKKFSELESALLLIFDTIVEHGNIIAEDFLIQSLLVNHAEKNEEQALRFLLALGDQFKHQKESGQYYESWAVVGFNPEILNASIQQFIADLENKQSVLSEDALIDLFKLSQTYEKYKNELTDKVIKSYLNLSKQTKINPFDEIGLKEWSEVKPRDVGDKASLVLKHHGKPEHYLVITEMINSHKFDNRIAYQETVHNELIKDNRFVLVGRGIYALSEWGYKKGVVADVIKDVIAEASHPLTRDEIVEEVMKKRQVKRNTILVGLSNKKNFLKNDKGKYILVGEPESKEQSNATI
jgi:hypothetical protein